MPFVYHRLGETNPSWLLINLLQYFRFGFEFAEIFDCILGMRTDSSAYSQSVSSFTLRIQQIRTTKTTQRFFPRILSILYVRTDSCRVFSVYIHTIEVYPIEMNPIEAYLIGKGVVEVSSCHPAFKGTLRQKWSEGELFDLKSNKKK
jgi:hypothetical protein